MVIKERKWVPKEMVIKILNGTEKPEEQVEKLKEEINNLPNPRQPREPAPEGGISIRAASRKYKIPSPTICRWVNRGYIPVLLFTSKEKYISEKAIAEIALEHHQAGGQGKWTISKKMKGCSDR